MEVILLERIHKLGELGQQVKVKSGYGRNYLVPQGKAIAATPDNIAKFEERRAELEKVQNNALASATARAKAFEEFSITIARKAGEEGKLYGSVGTVDIAEAATAAGEALEKQEVRLPDGPLRNIGEHTVAVHLHADINASIVVNVVAEEDQPT